MIRTIIIDDEPSAVNVLSILLRKHCNDDIQIVSTTNSPYLGINLINEFQPQLVFLDVEMPGLSGIELAKSFTNPTFRVVFITAHNAYAVEAFRLSAIDYLMKPVEAEDIIRVVDKIKKDIGRSENIVNTQLQHLQKILMRGNGIMESKIGIGMVDRIVFVDIADILYCEAQGAYTNVFLSSNKKIVASKSLGDFETQLANKKFFRIHHSTLINLNKIKEFQRFDGGYVMMENNFKLEVSQRKRKDFLDAVNNIIV